MPTLTANEEFLRAMAIEAIDLGMRDGKTGPSKVRINARDLMEILRLDVTELHPYARALRRIYGAAMMMQRGLEQRRRLEKGERLRTKP
jgi:hypothetical protein